MKITVAMVMDAGPCATWPRERIEKIAGGRTEAELADILRDERIPSEDRVWVGIALLDSDKRQIFANRTADRAVRTHALGTTIDGWARAWLDGSDRTAESAQADWEAQAAQAAWMAAQAAWMAALTARAAQAARAAWTARAARAAQAAAEERNRQLADMIEIDGGAG